jgi:shikimate kinase
MMKIFLIGFMGSGKTTFGKKLAKSLDYPFFDLDHQIVDQVNQSIPAYFAQHGELAFRELERKVLQNSNYPSDCVISCGGGTPCFFDNMDWMNKQGLTVYLYMTAAGLAKRLEPGKHQRPLLKDLDQGAMIGFIETKLQERRSFYERAMLQVEGLGVNPEKVKELILGFKA